MRRALVAAVIALAPAPLSAEPVTVMRVIDGDTLIISEPCSRLMPGSLMRIRVRGIDTPESRKPPAKCKAEIVAGKAAAAFAQDLIRPGTEVDITAIGPDKYGCRLVGSVRLPDGRDLAQTLIAAGHARPYGDGGSLRKSSWCPVRAPKR